MARPGRGTYIQLMIDDLYSAKLLKLAANLPHSGRLAAEALKVMDERKINGLIVVDAERRPIGALNMHNLFKAGVA